MSDPDLEVFFDRATNTVTALIADPQSGAAAVIDPVLDFDARTGRVTTASLEAVLEAARSRGWRIERVLETHAHADHLSGADEIRRRTGARVGVGVRITEVQTTFAPLFGMDGFKGDGAQFDDLFEDKAHFRLGELDIEVLHTPGHTPACVTYRIGAIAFVGDTLFMQDFGTARCDFPGGDASTLFRSIQRILSLPSQTRLITGHDYPGACGRTAPEWESSVAQQKQSNRHVGGQVDEGSFVEMRRSRDAGLEPPALLWPALQVNIRAGALPDPDERGRRFLRLPLKLP